MISSHISLNKELDCPLKPSPSSSSISAEPGYFEQHLHGPERERDNTYSCYNNIEELTQARFYGLHPQ